MNSKVGSLEEKVKLPPTETISRCYQPQGNRKVIRILTVAVYVLCVSLAAIMLSLYYIFIWDPTIRPFVTKANNCDKIVIPEKIAIRLLNSSEVTAEQFYKHILEQYRILNQLQQQRQQFLQKQHIHLQQLAAANKFQEIFATATIIQSNPKDPYKRPITPTNGTFLLEQLLATAPPPPQLPPAPPVPTAPAPIWPATTSLPVATSALQPVPRPYIIADAGLIDMPVGSHHPIPILDTAIAAHLTRRRSRRKHYNNNNNSSNSRSLSNKNHHRHNTRRNHKKVVPHQTTTPAAVAASEAAAAATGVGSATVATNQSPLETSFNVPASILHSTLQQYTPMPIPLILNSNEDKYPYTHTHSHHIHADKRIGGGSASVGGRKRLTSATAHGYNVPTYLNPLLTGELIFEK